MKLTALGGLGHIGANMMLVSKQGHSFAIDCGLMFPQDEHFGINYLSPDFKQIEKLDFILITHGHEDHIGALPALSDFFPDTKIYAPPFAFELIAQKLAANKKRLKLTKVDPSQDLHLAGLEISYIEVNHSIPHSYGLSILDREKSSHVFFASDFKVHNKCSFEKAFNFSKLKEKTKDAQFRYLMADSTNITNSSLRARSEEELIPELENIIQRSQYRCFITLFSSNIYRIKHLLEIAKKNNKKIVLYGRSLHKYVEIADHLELLNYKDFQQLERVDDFNDTIILLTGCQGEMRGALSRVASGEDKYFKPHPKDQFVFSSKTIPGNEKNVMKLVNKLSQFGCELIFDHKDYPIHATGHACKEDLLDLYKEYNPTHFIPVHGEYYFLYEHLKFAKKHLKNCSFLLMENGESLLIKGDNPSISHEFTSNYLFYHGSTLEIEKSEVNNRRRMAERGCIFISCFKDKRKAMINLSSYGLAENLLDKEHLTKLLRIEFRDLGARKNFEQKKDHLKKVVGTYCQNKMGYKPKVFIQVND